MSAKDATKPKWPKVSLGDLAEALGIALADQPESVRDDVLHGLRLNLALTVPNFTDLSQQKDIGRRFEERIRATLKACDVATDDDGSDEQDGVAAENRVRQPEEPAMVLRGFMPRDGRCLQCGNERWDEVVGGPDILRCRQCGALHSGKAVLA